MKKIMLLMLFTMMSVGIVWGPPDLRYLDALENSDQDPTDLDDDDNNTVSDDNAGKGAGEGGKEEPDTYRATTTQAKGLATDAGHTVAESNDTTEDFASPSQKTPLNIKQPGLTEVPTSDPAAEAAAAVKQQRAALDDYLNGKGAGDGAKPTAKDPTKPETAKATEAAANDDDDDDFDGGFDGFDDELDEDEFDKKKEAYINSMKQGLPDTDVLSTLIRSSEKYQVGGVKDVLSEIYDSLINEQQEQFILNLKSLPDVSEPAHEQINTFLEEHNPPTAVADATEPTDTTTTAATDPTKPETASTPAATAKLTTDQINNIINDNSAFNRYLSQNKNNQTELQQLKTQLEEKKENTPQETDQQEWQEHIQQMINKIENQLNPTRTPDISTVVSSQPVTPQDITDKIDNTLNSLEDYSLKVDSIPPLTDIKTLQSQIKALQNMENIQSSQKYDLLEKIESIKKRIENLNRTNITTKQNSHYYENTTNQIDENTINSSLSEVQDSCNQIIEKLHIVTETDIDSALKQIFSKNSAPIDPQKIITELIERGGENTTAKLKTLNEISKNFYKDRNEISMTPNDEKKLIQIKNILRKSVKERSTTEKLETILKSAIIEDQTPFFQEIISEEITSVIKSKDKLEKHLANIIFTNPEEIRNILSLMGREEYQKNISKLAGKLLKVYPNKYTFIQDGIRVYEEKKTYLECKKAIEKINNSYKKTKLNDTKLEEIREKYSTALKDLLDDNKSRNIFYLMGLIDLATKKPNIQLILENYKNFQKPDRPKQLPTGRSKPSRPENPPVATRPKRPSRPAPENLNTPTRPSRNFGAKTAGSPTTPPPARPPRPKLSLPTNDSDNDYDDDDKESFV